MIVSGVLVVGPKEIADLENGFIHCCCCCDIVAVVEGQKLVVVVNGNVILDDWIIGVVT